jgi:mono/diheme cytochrome c family protein
MVINLLVILFMMVVTSGLVLLALRSWRAKKPVTRFGGGLLASMLVLLSFALTGLMAKGAVAAYWPKKVPPAQVEIAYTSERIARGEHLAETLCASCHSQNGEIPLIGGPNLSDDIGLPLGDLHGPNITPGGRLAELTDGQIVTFFRQGRLPDGRITVMPVQNIGNLSDEDLYSVIAFIRSQEPIENEMPKIRFSPLALLMVGGGLIEVDFPAKPASITAPPVGPTAEYGSYIIGYNDCRDCHGQNFDGIVSGPIPPGPSLLHVRGWTADQFVTTMRTGINPSGHEMQLPMPWRQIGKLDDVELTAMYEYLKSVPVMTGN